MKKKDKGITLIALVVTIVLLIILATISINIIFGQNGIINKTQQGTELHDKEKVREKLTLMLSEYPIEQKMKGSSLLEFLQNKQQQGKIQDVTDNEDGTITVIIDGYEATIKVDTLEIIDIRKTGPKPVINAIKVVENRDGTGEALAKESVEDENKKIYINFTHAMSDGGVTTVNPSIPFEVSKNGSYEFTVTGPNGETRIINVIVNQYKEKPKIGDRVAYDEGYSEAKTNTVDTSFKMKDLDWRILDIESNGTVELISTQPTDSKLTLSGEQGYLKCETKLDTLCSQLYANGTGVTARSLKVGDIDKLAGITTEEQKKQNSYGGDYGKKYKIFWYSGYSSYLAYTVDDEGPYVGKGSYFKAPNGSVIDENHPSATSTIYPTFYQYDVRSLVTLKSEDDLSLADIICNGLDNSGMTSRRFEYSTVVV